MRTSLGYFIFGALLVCVPARADLTITEGTNITVDASADGQLVMDLIGGLWTLPGDGGGARRLPVSMHAAGDPRVSADNSSIVYVAEQAQATELWIYDIDRAKSRPLATEFGNYAHPDWHPDGDRVVFTADAMGDGLDLWEVDVATGLRWRLTHGNGESTWPTWSDDGRDLVYIRQLDDEFQLVLRRRGELDEVLLASPLPMYAPAFRPDKSLVTVLVDTPSGLRVDMVILSVPRLVRTLIEDDDIFIGRIAWPDRQRMLYTAGGHIRERHFNSWTSKNVEFTARVEPPRLAPGNRVTGRRLSRVAPAARALVVRADRLLDGLSREYRENVDIIVENGKIVSVEPVAERPGSNLVDLGDITVLPGLIDVYARLPDEVDDVDGARLLGFGITTVVTDHPAALDLDRRWTDPATPGPRVLNAAPLESDVEREPWLFVLGGDRDTGEALSNAARQWQEAGVPVLAANWQVGIGAGANLVLGNKALPASPVGRRYADLTVTNGARAITVVSALAHAGTRDLDALFEMRQAVGLDSRRDGVRRRASPTLAPGQGRVVLGSRPNRLPPGIAQHAELRALVEGGLEPVDAIRAATVDAATALGLGLSTGRVATGADANFVLVLGDPMNAINDAANVVGVVQNGRFMSLGRLLDRLPTH